jgi:long-subunit acyl-CoA synthetase (AMP-forming)
MCTSSLITSIQNIGKYNPTALAIQGESVGLSYGSLVFLIEKYSKLFSKYQQTGFAIDVDNGPEWVVLDLALLYARKVNVPIPKFFTNSQIKHLLIDAGIQIVFTDTPKKIDGDIYQKFKICDKYIYQVNLHNATVKYPANTVKVTYTSGTTGEPKGVCINTKSIDKTVHSIIEISGVDSSDRHFSALPLTILLENIGGIYATLMCGATAIIYPQYKIGISGATGINPSQFIHTINSQSPTTTILMPQMLGVIVNMLNKEDEYLNSMKFIAIGGAPISEQIIKQAQLIGLPVYEGYGLSESTSVITVNGPSANKIGTVGKPLPHIDLKIAKDGEVLVKGAIFNGYLGQNLDLLDIEGYLPTGDIGRLDDDGFLILQGRKKDIFITSFGRNVSPEWVERELSAQPGVLQVVVFGDEKPWNIAVILTTPKLDIGAAINKANQILPDYANVSSWVCAHEPFSVANGQLTGTSRPRRKKIWLDYQQQIEDIYQLEGGVK